MPASMFEQAVQSLKGYWGVVGVFGGNPATSPFFTEYCEILRLYFPREQCGLWCNDPMTQAKAQAAAKTFDPAVSNLNVHLDRGAYKRFKEWWPSSRPFGLEQDSRHAPVYVAMKDVVRKPCKGCQYCNAHGTAWEDGTECDGTGEVPDTERIHELISDCDINKHWSAMIGMFRGQLRAWFCEIAGAQSILHQDDMEYPDTGLDPRDAHYTGEIENGYVSNKVTIWWQLPMRPFTHQVRKHCFDCGVPLRGYGELAQAKTELDENASSDVGAECWIVPKEQVSETHTSICNPKRAGRQVEVVTTLEQLGVGRLAKITDYLGNAKR